MLTCFKSFFESGKHKNGTYVACDYTSLSARMLHFWAESRKVPNLLAHDEFHTSIMYSRSALPKEHHVSASVVQMGVRSWAFLPTGFDIFKSEGKDALVMKIDAPELTALHQQLRAVGGTHDFPTYEPHVTLSYDIPAGYDPSLLELPSFYLVPSIIYTRPLEL